MLFGPLQLKFVVRRSPRLRWWSRATRSAHHRVCSSVQSVGVGHADPPIKRLPAESGPAVSTLDARSDTEPESPARTKRGPGRPERGRSGEFTVLTSSHECRRMGLYSQPVHRRREGSPLADGEVEGRASVACDRESGLYFSRRGVCIRISDSTAPLRNDEDITVSLVVGFIPRLNSGTTTARSCNANRTQ